MQNRWSSLLVALVAFSIVARDVCAQEQRPVAVVEHIGTAVITRASGGSVKIHHGMSTVSNRSTLELEWVMVTDSTLGIIFDGPVGANGTYDDPWFRYESDMKMKALVPVQAFEVRILTFDVWHQFTGTLSFSQLEDMVPNQEKSFDRVWGIYGESQLRDHFVSVAYVAKVRLADGRTVIADPTPALKAAQAIQASITVQDLEPKPEPIPLQSKKMED
jgi:hypothetical protein